jgi:predicted  nucleic acid-binding Zn-ribbon protein
MINSGHHPVIPPHVHSGTTPRNSGRHELKTPTNASVRASSVSAAKQERLEALRSERHRIMQMQTTILSRPRSVAGTPQAPVRSPAMGPRANPQPLVFQTHSSVPQDSQGPSNALAFEIEQLKQEISRLKLEVDRYRTMQSKDHGRIKELETDLDMISSERDRLQEQHQKDTASRGSDSRRFAEIQNELSLLRDRSNPETLEKLNQEIKNLRAAISREKDRVFVLMTEKQQLEEQLNDVRTTQFKAEQVQSELVSLRVQVSEFSEWKTERSSLVSQIESLKGENESLTKQLRSEKSQRLVLAARVDELQKFMENAETVIGTCDSNLSQRGSVVSSIPPLNEADIPTRRNTMEVSESFAPTRVVLPGVETRSMKTPEKQPVSLDLFSPPETGGDQSKRSTSLQYQPTLIASRPPESSFVDIEQRGSAKKLDESSQRLGSLLDTNDEGNDDGFGLIDQNSSPREVVASADAVILSRSPKNDIGEIFGAPSIDPWNTKPHSPALKYNVNDQAPPVEPPVPNYHQPQQGYVPVSQPQMQPAPANSHVKSQIPFAGSVPATRQVHAPVRAQGQVQAPVNAPLVAFKPAQTIQSSVSVTKAPAHSLIRPQGTAVPQRGFSPAASPAPTAQAPVMPVHPAFGGNRNATASPGPFANSIQPTHQPMQHMQQAHQPMQHMHPAHQPMQHAQPVNQPVQHAQPVNQPVQHAQHVHQPMHHAQPAQQGQPVNQVPRPTGFPGSISSVTPQQTNVFNPQAGYNPYPQQQRYGNGPFR